MTVMKGDLDNTPIPRVYIVWEGTIARRAEQKSLLTRVLSRRSLLEVDDEVRAHLWDNWLRLGVRFDAVTFEHDPDEVQAVCDRENLPINSTWGFLDKKTFIAMLPRMPWVSHVIDHEAPLAYGGRGATLDSVRR